jgi:hypothetical protein
MTSAYARLILQGSLAGVAAFLQPSVGEGIPVRITQFVPSRIDRPSAGTSWPFDCDTVQLERGRTSCEGHEVLGLTVDESDSDHIAFNANESSAKKPNGAINVRTNDVAAPVFWRPPAERLGQRLRQHVTVRLDVVKNHVREHVADVMSSTKNSPCASNTPQISHVCIPSQGQKS